VATAAVVRWQMEHRQHPEQGYRSCLGLQRLAPRVHGTRGWRPPAPGRMAIRSPNLQAASPPSCASGLDQRQPVPPKPAQASLPLHENVRGPGYYH
jgi:hypothetical protein